MDLDKKSIYKRIFSDKTDYCLYWERAVELERIAEKEFHLKEIAKLSPKERERKGRAVLDLKSIYLGEIIGEFYLYKFYRENMPEHQINVGDVVLVSRKHPLKDGVEGTVFEKGKSYITVAFSQMIPPCKKCRLDLFVNDITFKRMLGALEFFEKGYSVYNPDIILGNYKFGIETDFGLKSINGFDNVNTDFEFINENLNIYQREAVIKALMSEELFLIHGPPGTGKTTTLVETIIQHIKRGDKVLATADSNTAVDNIVEGLIRYKVNVVRIGHPARLKKELLDVSIDSKVENHTKYGEIRKLKKKIDKLKSLQEKYLKPTAQRRRGLTDNQIFKFAKAGKKVRGYTVDRLKSMAEWLRLQKDIKKLNEQKYRLETEIIEEILGNVDVIATTNSSAGAEILMEKYFDTVFIDEASQSTEPSCLIPIIKAKKLVMAGDHKQLPPTVLNKEASQLTYTMFERFMDIYPSKSYMLRIQYRMNEKIAKFPSQMFYSNGLITDDKVKNIKLSDIANIDPSSPITDDTPIVFIDTGGKYTEEQKKGSSSRYNPKEAELVKDIVEKLKKIGVNSSDIGIITPYKDHEEYLKQLIPDVEVKTVDGFQGREKEVIIISLVRSNPNEEIGFLDDIRRLNVAITRAKRKLIIVGDGKTLSSNKTYRDLINYINIYE